MKILIIKLKAIGDIILSTPVVENIKNNFSDSKIYYLVEKFAAPILENNKFIDGVISFDKKNESGLDLIIKIRKEKFDIVIDLFGNPRSALVTFLSGAKNRIGYNFRFRSFAYNFVIEPRGNLVHNIDFNLDSLKYFNINNATRNPKIFLTENISNEIKVWEEKNILNRDFKIGINAGGGWEIKQWKSLSFAKLCDELILKENAKIFLFYGPNEFEKICEIKSLIKSKVEIIPKTNLQELAYLVNKMNFFISNDSGPMHIAATLNVPTLGIYGPTNPNLQGPIGINTDWVRMDDLDCIGCNKTVCKINNICMTDLSVEKVFDKAKIIIGKIKNEK